MKIKPKVKVTSGTMGSGNPYPKKTEAQRHETLQAEDTNENQAQGVAVGEKNNPSMYYMKLYKAVLNGDSKVAQKFFESDTSALTARISNIGETVLHVAVTTGHSIQFLRNLVEGMRIENDSLPDDFGSTPLHYAACVGNTAAAKILVAKNSQLTQFENQFGQTPVHSAAMFCHKETVSYLLSVTRHEDPSPFSSKSGVKLIKFLIIADFYDIALDVLRKHPELAVETSTNGNTILKTLAQKPKAFQSGKDLAQWQRYVYQIFENLNTSATTCNGGDVENPQMHEPKKMDVPAVGILKLSISQALKVCNLTQLRELLKNPLFLATKFGILEFVEEIIKAYPSSVLLFNDQNQTLFHVAVVHRQEKIFNLIFQLSLYKHLVASYKDNKGNNMLHLAGKLAPQNRISGAALQMQRELLWFKEVEKIVQPSYKEKKNKEGITPRQLFTEEHKVLVQQGEKWLKDTATSYAFVAALVVTIAFAATFTVPGGSDQNNGIPIFSKEPAFMIYAISNAMALFSSATSLLMFLRILTSRYSEEDFMRALPMRLSIGLITLFFSIASILAAFSASLYLVLSHQVSWIYLPIGLFACVPVILFARLQFPLLREIVCATFGPSIFRKQSEEMIL